MRRRHPCTICKRTFHTIELPEQALIKMDAISALVLDAAKGLKR